MFKLPSDKKWVFVAVVPLVWFVTLSLFAITFTTTILVNSTQRATFPDPKYSIYSSKPLVLGAVSNRLWGGDARAAALDQFFASYGCPMQNLGQTFVEEADENGIPFWIVPSIAFQESSCGKSTPKIDGGESFNAYGYGVWGKNVKQFNNWEHGIKVMSGYMNDRFFSQGITEPCDIMKVYTPPSKGSWCDGINFFKDRITTYSTPI